MGAVQPPRGETAPGKPGGAQPLGKGNRPAGRVTKGKQEPKKNWLFHWAAKGADLREQGLEGYFGPVSRPWKLLLVLAPLAVLLLCQWITLQSLGQGLLWLEENFWPALLTWLVLLLAAALVTSMTDRLLLGVLAIFLPCVGLALASQMKQAVNGLPLLIEDLALAGQAMQIAQFVDMDLDASGVNALCLTAGSVLLMAAAFHTRPVRRTARQQKRRRCLAALAALGAALVVAEPVLYGAQLETQAQRNDRLGILGGLYAGARSGGMKSPEGYSAEEMEQIRQEFEQPPTETQVPEEPAVQPNVILLVSESFFDPTCLPHISWSEDPVPNYHALAKQFPSGTFLSNTYAGGTGNVEMEILTGIPSAFLTQGASLTSLGDAEKYQSLPSIVRTFSEEGYQTAFVHSYNDELYNRSMTMEAVGYDQVMFQEDFTVERRQDGGRYVSDDALTDQIIALLEEKEDGPIFLHALSMENHQPYSKEKYDSPSPVQVRSDRLEGEMLEMMECLTHGLYHADAALGRLTKYLAEFDEPTLLVFLGDHLPGLYLGKDRSCFAELGYVDTEDTSQWDADTLLRMHGTQFLVWDNYGTELKVPETVSCGSLGSRMLSWAGVPKPLYFNWVDWVAERMLLYRGRLYVSTDGTAYDGPPEEDAKLIGAYQSIVYDILYGQQYIAGEMTGTGSPP